jgi:Protein of unknown function (DUF3828)
MKKPHIILSGIVVLLATGPMHAQTTAQAESFVRHLYSEYTTPPKQNSPDFMGREMSLAFSPALARIIRAELRKTPKGEVGKIDGDPICNCQDWEKLSIAKLDIAKTGNTTAVASVSIKNMDATRSLKLFLIWTAQGWRIDDIWTSDTPSYKKYLLEPEAP